MDRVWLGSRSAGKRGRGKPRKMLKLLRKPMHPGRAQVRSQPRLMCRRTSRRIMVLLPFPHCKLSLVHRS